MSSILDSLLGQLGGDTLNQLGTAIGADPGTTQRAVAAALPTLLTGLARNASSGGGANALLAALDRDHDGSILDDIGSFLGGGDSTAGDGILGHVLGGQRPAVESGLSAATGLGAGSVSKLLAMLAPLVMGALGQAKREQGLDGDGLSSLLRGEQARAAEARPDVAGMLGQLLDANRDGSVVDDVVKVGGGLLGSLFGRKR